MCDICVFADKKQLTKCDSRKCVHISVTRDVHSYNCMFNITLVSVCATIDCGKVMLKFAG